MGLTIANGLDEMSWETCESPRHLLRYLRTRTSELERWAVWFGMGGAETISLKMRWVILACCEQLAGPSPSRRVQRSLDLAEQYLETPLPTNIVERRKVINQLNGGRGRAVSAIASALTSCSAAGLGMLREASACQAKARIENKSEKETTFQAELITTARVQSDIIRDVFGNPFSPTQEIKNERREEVEHWLNRNDGTARKLVAAMEDEHHYDQIPILADALEEAGCEDADVLAHCRNGKIHVRGCWVMQLLQNTAMNYVEENHESV
ncbi:MAG: hypothetical protein ACFCD0_25605 [Gemmataceae bacterium]